MEIKADQSRQALVEWVNQLAQGLSGRVDDTAVDSVRRIIGDYQRESLTIAVIGKAKRGKSTLINALLGRTDDLVAPIDKLPTSSAVSRFAYGEHDKATVVFRDGAKKSIPFKLIRNYVTEELNPGNKEEVNVVEIEGPFPGLAEGLVLVDTPGSGSIHEHHDQLLHKFIPEADAVIYLVTARMPLDQDELELLRYVKAADIRKVFFVINRVDDCTESDLKDAIDHNVTLLKAVGDSTERIYPISAKRAFHGAHEAAGLTILISDISSFVSRSREEALNARFITRSLKVLEPAIQSLEFDLAVREGPMRNCMTISKG